MHPEYLRGAAHEPGHAIVGLAVGRPFLYIARVKGTHSGSLLEGSPDESCFVEYGDEKFEYPDPRLSYLHAAGGMAGEVINAGRYDPLGASDDIARLKGVGLDDAQIEGLIKIARKIIEANFDLWRQVASAFLNGIAQNRDPLVQGKPVNDVFSVGGKKFTDFTDLDKLLPPD